MPWTAVIAKADNEKTEYPDVIEVLIGHYNTYQRESARLYLETRQKSVDEFIRSGESVTLTWKP